MKKAVLISTLKKLHKMASDDKALVPSALQKLHEFVCLDYEPGRPTKLLWTVCTTGSNDKEHAMVQDPRSDPQKFLPDKMTGR